MKAPRLFRGDQAQRGVALLSALFAVALLTIIVIEMTDATMVHTNLTRNAGNAMAAQLLARSAAVAAEALIADDTVNDPKLTCPNGSLWAAPLIGIPAGAGTVSLEIVDEGGKLDLNSVGNQPYREVVERLFSELDLDPSLAGRIAAWIEKRSADGAMATGGGSDYCSLSMPCEPRQEPMKSLDELLLIRGFDEQTLRLLRRYVTVIPAAKGGTVKLPKVNVNTADPLVLTALGCESADTLPECTASFDGDDQKAEDFRGKLEAWRTDNCPANSASLMASKSDVFSVRSVGTVGDVSQTLRTLVRRDGNRVTRLWWQERPVLEPLPVEIR